MQLCKALVVPTTCILGSGSGTLQNHLTIMTSTVGYFILVVRFHVPKVVLSMENHTFTKGEKLRIQYENCIVHYQLHRHWIIKYS